MGCLTGFIWELLESLDFLGLLEELVRDLHLDGTATWQELGLGEEVPCDTDSIMEVPLHLVQDVLRGASEEHTAGTGCLALEEEGEVLITDLLDLEESALLTDIALLDLVGSIDDLGTCDTGDPVVVSLPCSPKDGDVGLHQVVLCEVYMN